MVRKLTRFVALALASVLRAQTTVPIPIDAHCVDPSGRPVAGVEFGDLWSCADGVWRPGFQCPDPNEPLRLVSDATGHVAGTWILSPIGTPLLGWNRERTLVAFVAPTHDPATHESFVRGPIAMRRAVRVRCSLRTTATVAHHRLVVAWNATGPVAPGHEPMRHWFAFSDSRAEFEIALPEGHYELLAGAGSGAALPRTLVLGPAHEVLELGPISVPLPALDLIGEVLPDWHVTHARKLAPEEATLGRFRGKPLLIQFGEFGNPPRLDQASRDALGRLAIHPRRDAFHVVLFGSTRDWLAGLPERPPHPEFDRLFPRPKAPEPPIESLFPLLSDESGTTESRYGVLTFGAALLDEDGRLLLRGDTATAIAALEKRLADRR